MSREILEDDDRLLGVLEVLLKKTNGENLTWPKFLFAIGTQLISGIIVLVLMYAQIQQNKDDIQELKSEVKGRAEIIADIRYLKQGVSELKAQNMAIVSELRGFSKSRQANSE